MRFDAQIPEELGGYRLIRRLGRGGMAEVWLVHKIGDPLQKSWVMKIMLPEHTASPKHQARFLSEVKTLASLRHGCIVPIFHYGVDKGFYFLIMEYIDGVNLRVFVKELESKGERLPYVAVLYVAAQLADGLRHAHDRTRAGAPRGVIHRDVKPSNVLISSDGEVLVTDFGLARYEEDFSHDTFGTRAYVAPEQARGAAGPQSDIYGLGATMHFMLTGEAPRRVSSHTLDIEHLLDDPPPPTGRDDVPELVERIRWGCLQPSVAHRYAAMKDVLKIIETHPYYQRCALMLKEYYLRYIGAPRTGTTEALAMAMATEPAVEPRGPSKAEPAADDELTTFWQLPAATPSEAGDQASAAAHVPPEYRPAPAGRVEADAPKVRRRPRGASPSPSESVRIEATEILSTVPSVEATRDTTERLDNPPSAREGARDSVIVVAPEPRPAAVVVPSELRPTAVVVPPTKAPRPRMRPVLALGVVSLLTLVGLAITRVGLDDIARDDSPSREGPSPAAPVGQPPEARIHVVVIVGGVAGGEVELGDQRIPLDPIAHASLPPGRYPLRWRDAESGEWRDAGTVDVSPADVQAGLLRIDVSPTEGARVERRP